MNSPIQPVRSPYRNFVLWALCGWTVVIAAFVGFELANMQREGIAVALSQARAAVLKDIAYREWAANQPAIYVPATEKTPPNPFLANRPERDVTTLSGVNLTLVNPAYMTRMVYELGSGKYGLTEHLTSLKPIRPANSADAWESNALAQLERGAPYVSEITPSTNGRDFRYIAPLKTTEACLKCHAQQGYKVGDIRGGISVSFPFHDGLLTFGQADVRPSVYGALGLWLLGVAGIQFVHSREQKRDEQEREAQKALHAIKEQTQVEKRQRHEGFQFTLQSAMDGFWLANTSGRLLDVNDAYCRMSGYSREELLRMSVSDLEKVETPQDVSDRIAKLRQQGNDRFETLHRRKDGAILSVEASLVFLPDPEGRIAGFFKDITHRKREEMELAGRIKELQRWHDVTLNREGRVRELKREVNQLLLRLNEPLRYQSVGSEAHPVIEQAEKPPGEI